MNRRQFLQNTGAVALLPLATRMAMAQNAAQRRPNVLFVLVDDLRYDALSILGHPVARTPNIDRIGREGMIFDRAFITTSLCSPSRASFLTGQYVHTHGIVGNEPRGLRNFAHDTSLQTYGRLLQPLGYETAHIGKWHMDPSAAPRPGWDYWASFRGQGSYLDQTFNINGEEVPKPGYITDAINSMAVDFIKRPHQKPWVMNVWHKAVHGPFVPAERHKDLYAGQTIPHSPANEDTLEGKPVLKLKSERLPARQAQEEGGKRAPGNEDAKAIRQLRALAAVDEGVGLMLTALEETGQLDNTLVVFSSDNGFFWGERGLGDKRGPWEESIRVPLLMRFPKMIKAGTRAPEMALNIDLAPTLLELAGAKAPATIQGTSLVPLFRTATDPNLRPIPAWRQTALLEYYQEAQYPLFPDWQCARTEHFKIIHYPQYPRYDELYDLQNDPYELKNLIAEPKSQDMVRQMRSELTRLLKETKTPDSLPKL